jgi:hypothetical protein
MVRCRWEASRALVLGVLLAGVCSAAATAAPQRGFEARNFTGLTAKVISSEDDATIDFDFEKLGGGRLHLVHCREVPTALMDQVQVPEAIYAEMLRLNCQAVHRYVKSQPARRSHMPARWSRSAVAKLPAQVLPELGPDNAATPTVTQPRLTLARRPGGRHITLDSDGDVSVDGPEVHALFYQLAQADFNGDGYQDWLLRMDWGAKEGSMKGSQLLLVTRLVPDGPLRLLERISR